MENRDRVREQGVPDQPPERPTPGHEDEDPAGQRRIREDDDHDLERQSPRRDPQPERPPKIA